LPERLGHCGLLQAAIDLAQRASGLVVRFDVQHAAAGLFDHRHATAGRSVEPAVDDPATG
jgi:hypothetical protein